MKKLNKITFWIFTALTVIFWGQGASSFLESFKLGEIANSIISLSWGVLTALWVKALVITLKPSDEDEYSNSDSGITTFTPDFYQPNGRINTDKTFKLRFGKFSVKDATWDKDKKVHKCCGSKKAVRHHIKCRFLETISSDDLSDLK